jgi:hypothetical protein
MYVDVQRGSSIISAVSIFCFTPFNPFHYPFTPIFKQLSIHIFILSTFTDITFYEIFDALSFSIPFPPSLINFGLLYAS